MQVLTGPRTPDFARQVHAQPKIGHSSAGFRIRAPRSGSHLRGTSRCNVVHASCLAPHIVPAPGHSPAPSRRSAGRSCMTRVLYLLFILSGAAGLIYESIWTRYLGLFVGHDAYAQIIVLVIFLGGMSAGAVLVSRFSERLRDPLRGYAMVE